MGDAQNDWIKSFTYLNLYRIIWAEIFIIAENINRFFFDYSCTQKFNTKR